MQLPLFRRCAARVPGPSGSSLLPSAWDWLPGNPRAAGWAGAKLACRCDFMQFAFILNECPARARMPIKNFHSLRRCPERIWQLCGWCPYGGCLSKLLLLLLRRRIRIPMLLQSNCANAAAANPQSDKANNFAKINMRDYCAGCGRQGGAGGAGWGSWKVCYNKMQLSRWGHCHCLPAVILNFKCTC